LGSEVRHVFETVGAELLQFAHSLDALGYARDDLEARGGELFGSGVTHRETIAHAGDSITRELSRLTGELREILERLRR
jgi:hypothetical protein